MRAPATASASTRPTPRLRPGRQPENEPLPGDLVRLDAERAAVCLDDSPRDEEAEAPARSRLEGTFALLVVGRPLDLIQRERDLDVAVEPTIPDEYLAALRGGPDGARRDVREGIPHALLIA